MTREGLQQVALAIVTGVTAGSLVLLGLWLSARPAHQDARISDLRSVARDLGAANLVGPAPAAAPCRSDPVTAARVATDTLKGVAVQAGMSLGALEFAAVPTSSVDLRAIGLTLKLGGSEAALSRFVRDVAGRRLPVFLDTVDIRRSAAGEVQATFTGRLLCRR